MYSEVNRVEASYWRLAGGQRVDFSDRILGFDCGGEQHVMEVAFPVSKSPNNDNSLDSDMRYMLDLLQIIENDADGIAAPSPIEQRWTACSSAVMSPAYSSDAQMFSWVGIIMYLPPTGDDAREAVNEVFAQYVCRCQAELWEKYDAKVHWGKIMLPVDDHKRGIMQRSLQRQYPLGEFNAWRGRVDPKGILSNKFTNDLLGGPIN